MDNATYIANIILNIIAAVVLFMGVLYLIERIKKKREEAKIVRETPAAKPFPQRVYLPARFEKPQQVSQTDMEEAIRRAYREWQGLYLLEGQDLRSSFVHIGAEKRRLSYQVTTTSMANALALVISVLMAGEDVQAASQFDRILSFLLAHPSSASDDLTSWYSMPDVPSSPKLEPDPHAEAWICQALWMAGQQWSGSERFDNAGLLRERMAALLALQEAQDTAQTARMLHAPFFYERFGQVSGAPGWVSIARETGSIADSLLAQRKNFTLDGSSEEAVLALTVLQLGLATLFAQEPPMRSVERLARAGLSRLAASVNDEPDDTLEGFSALSLLASTAPSVMSLGDQPLVDELWASLAQAEPSRKDAVGGSLRLLAMLILAGSAWF